MLDANRTILTGAKQPGICGGPCMRTTFEIDDDVLALARARRPRARVDRSSCSSPARRCSAPQSQPTPATACRNCQMRTPPGPSPNSSTRCAKRCPVGVSAWHQRTDCAARRLSRTARSCTRMAQSGHPPGVGNLPVDRKRRAHHRATRKQLRRRPRSRHLSQSCARILATSFGLTD